MIPLTVAVILMLPVSSFTFPRNLLQLYKTSRNQRDFLVQDLDLTNFARMPHWAIALYVHALTFQV